MISKEEFLTKYASNLNENQLKAVQTVEGPVLLLAVPGSGKTTVLVTRLGYMLYCEGIAPENILTLTYTIAATADMSRRFEKVFGSEYSGVVEFRTINGICAKIIQYCEDYLGKRAFELETDERVLTKVVNDILVSVMTEYPTESDVKAARTLITYCKNMRLEPEEIEDLGEEEGIELLTVYRKYNEYLKSNRKMDYDDQMTYAYGILKSYPDILNYYRNKFRYICVDEAQDTSKIQHMIIKLLAGESGNLFMVGDEDQSIYGFRAAYPEALLNFENEHPGAQVLVMDQNYRSNANIVADADRFIQKNKSRHEKHMVATRVADSETKYISLNTRSNQYGYLLKVADGCQRETAVLFRENDSSLPLIDQLERQGIPYRMKTVEMPFFTNRVVIDVLSFMKFAMNPYDTELFKRLYYKCKLFLKKPEVEKLCDYSVRNGETVFQAAEETDFFGKEKKRNLKALKTNLTNLLTETPAKAIFRIQKPIGYDDYLDSKNLDKGKIFIMTMLAYQEKTIGSFLRRLDYLNETIKNSKPDYNCNFVLSTIHSSKGLEYDRVFMMDVCNKIFPQQVITNYKKALPQEIKEFEEERRLFYVGMTRAKNELNIFTFDDVASSFVNDLRKPVVEKKDIKAPNARARAVAPKKDVNVPKASDIVIGARVMQNKYGLGTISGFDVDKMEVEFDCGVTKRFMFPFAFELGMKLVE